MLFFIKYIGSLNFAWQSQRPIKIIFMGKAVPRNRTAKGHGHVSHSFLPEQISAYAGPVSQKYDPLFILIGLI